MNDTQHPTRGYTLLVQPVKSTMLSTTDTQAQQPSIDLNLGRQRCSIALPHALLYNNIRQGDQPRHLGVPILKA
jgi:hypothetical protein